MAYEGIVSSYSTQSGRVHPPSALGTKEIQNILSENFER